MFNNLKPKTVNSGSVFTITTPELVNLNSMLLNTVSKFMNTEAM